ncbi:hypothetical protein CNYM01_14340, partial [Colletotrichum nymphaeae SA-01]
QPFGAESNDVAKDASVSSNHCVVPANSEGKCYRAGDVPQGQTGRLAGRRCPVHNSPISLHRSPEINQPRSSLSLLPRPDPPPTRDRPRLAQSEQGRQSNVHADEAMYAPACRLYLSSDVKFDRRALFPRNRPGRLT